MKVYMTEALVLANPEGDPDPDLDLAGHEKPKWTQYSLRRAGERSARNNQHRHGLPRAEIDLYSGWDLVGAFVSISGNKPQRQAGPHRGPSSTRTSCLCVAPTRPPVCLALA